MSDYQQHAETALEWLQTISPSFCLAKYFQSTIHLTTGKTSSCYHNPLHEIDSKLIAKDPRFLHNTVQKIKEREQMLQGIKPSGCSYCWKMEDQGNTSDRAYRSGEPWAWENRRATSAMVLPTYLEVNFNSVCNLRCSYCSPEFSTSWMSEIQSRGGYQLSKTTHNDPNSFERGKNLPILHREQNPYRDAFWKWWPDLYPALKHFRMTGGEPALDPNTYKVFDWILDNPKPDLHIGVTSNFSFEPNVFEKYLDYCKRLCEDEKIEHFMQFISVDTFGEHAEYARHGLYFDRLLEYTNRFLTEIPGRNSVSFISTMNIFTPARFHKLLATIYGLRQNHSTSYQRVWFDTPVLRQPSFLSMANLPDEYAWFLETNSLNWMKSLSGSDLNDFRDFEIERLQRAINWMRSQDSTERNLVDFGLFIREHDSRRGTNFVETFPEMKEFWGDILYYTDKFERER